MNLISPFTIRVADAELHDLKQRLDATRWPDELPNAGWSYGPADAFVRRAVEAWKQLDWRKREAELNQLPQFTTEIDGQRIHFVHLRSSHANATPLLLLHSWPGSFVEFLRVIGPLTEPTRFGGKETGAFHVVIPSLPGFAFSGPTRETGWTYGRMARALPELMSRLGYSRYGVHGADAGAVIAPEMARVVPDRVIGVHVNAATLGFIPLGPISEDDKAALTAAEKVRLQRMQQFMTERMGFNFLHSHRPQALAYAMNDSPVGMLAWLSELFTGFGDLADRVDLDVFVTNLAIYWFTQTVGSSMRHYYENAHDPQAWIPKQKSGVPTAVAVFEQGDVAIRRFSEAENQIVRWKEYAEGGHYAVLECPQVWITDIREFFADLSKR